MSHFYFAWVDPTETEFGHQHWVTDEKVLTFSIDHAEGNIPTLSIEIKNPRIGLLAPGRKVWAWLSVADSTGNVTPLFFGRLTGIPTNIIAEACTLSFTAKPLDYASQKQALAETMKVAPYYDPIWITAELIDDADTILEAYSALWHVDRTTLEVTASDIIVGEDGEIEFTQDDVFYDSLSVVPGQTPLVAVQMNGTVAWTQVATGTVSFSPGTFESEGAGTLFGAWPKAGDSLSGGWSVESASALDYWGINEVQTLSLTTTYTNKEATHEDGDTMSINTSASTPQFPVQVKVREVVTSLKIVSGFVDADGDPPLNIPSSVSSTTDYFPTWNVPTSLVLRYDASRPRTERVSFTLQADMQAILSLPEEMDHPQWAPNVVTDVGDQIINNQNLYVATGIVGDEAATTGITGMFGPRHLSGTVSDGTPATVGLVYAGPGFTDDTVISVAGGPGILWEFVSNDAASDQEVITMQARNVDLVMPGEPVFSLPDDGIPYINLLNGLLVPDGSPIGDPSKSSYFPSPRGIRSLEYLIAIARAHLLIRSRAITISWDCSLERAIELSCRKNARIFDHRLPGGVALGKITAYKISGDGDSGTLIGNVTIECAIGYGNAVTESPGTPTYVDDGYVALGYIARENQIVVLGSGDIGYAPPVAGVVDDGISFPIFTSGEVIVRETITDSTYRLELKPVVNGPFGADYFLSTTKLAIPQQINLEAHSS